MDKGKKGFFNKRTLWIAGYCVLLLAVALMFDRRLEVNRYSVDAEQIDGVIRLALLTDLHSSSYGKGCDKIIKALRKEAPDIVLLGGDIFDDVLSNDNATALVNALGSEFLCYYVSGNHEYWTNDIDSIKATVEAAGIEVLEGECYTVEVRGQKINICGVDDPVYDYDRMYRQMDAADEASDNGYYTVLLSHRPEMVEEYGRYGFDLVLAGHAHGGQMRVPYVLENGIYSPNQGWMPKYTSGLYELDGYDLIVSRGLDRDSVSVPRLFNRPEIVLVEVG